MCTEYLRVCDDFFNIATAWKGSSESTSTTATSQQFWNSSWQSSGSSNGNSDQWCDQGFLGDDCNTGNGQNSESSQLQFQKSEQWQQFLDDLLFGTSFNNQSANWFLNFVWDSIGKTTTSAGKVPTDWTYVANFNRFFLIQKFEFFQ